MQSVSNFFSTKIFDGRKFKTVKQDKLNKIFSFLFVTAIVLAGCKSPSYAPDTTLRLTSQNSSTPFDKYDAAFVNAVTKRWYDLLDTKQFPNHKGMVHLKFCLHSDGRITDMKVVKNTAGTLLGYVCQKAVEDPAPYASWPEEMRLKLGKDYRDMEFTFYYD